MAADPNQPAINCPQCGAPAAADQEYCLECGTRLTRAIAPARASRGPLVVLGVVLVLAGAGLAVAYDKLAKKDGNEKSAATSATQTPTFSVPTTTTTTPPTTTSPTTTTGGSTTGGVLPKLPIPGLGGGSKGGGASGGGGGKSGGGGGTPSGGGQPSTGVASWPSGKSAWTVVLYSASSKADGQAKARSASQKTSDVGLLNSSNFSSLQPGYWVVFAAQYDGKSAAESKASSLRGQGFPQAYARFVKPK